MKDNSNEECEDTTARMYEDSDSDPWEEWGDSVRDKSETHEAQASHSLNEASNEEDQDEDQDQDQDQDEGEGEDEDEDKNNEQQDLDRDEEAMDDDNILNKEGFVELWDSAQQLWCTYMLPVYLEYNTDLLNVKQIIQW